MSRDLGGSLDKQKNQGPSAPKSVRRRLAAILAADVAEYTRLVEQNITATVSAWQAARDDVFDPSVAEHEGRIVKLTGDGFLAEFPTVEAAVKCAVFMQEQLLSCPLRFRMGVSIGDIVDDGTDIYGEGINIAARLESIAEPGGILISGDVFNLIRNRIDETFQDLGEHSVRHVSQPVRIYALKRFSSEKQEAAPLPDDAGESPAAGPRKLFPAKHAAVGAIAVLLGIGAWLYASIGERKNPTASAPGSDAETAAARMVPNGAPNTALIDAAARPLSPGRNFKDCALCPMMTVVPAGSFRMGWAKGDPDEKPVVDVVIPASLAVGTYEITFREWDACVADNACGSYRPDDNGWGRQDRPVINVSWLDAQAYISWLRNRTGKKYRLLTEAEWEYAARGGSSDLYPWGVTIDAAKANYGLFRGKTLPVGSYDPNAFGIHDVIGNVWEWVNDCYGKDAYAQHKAYPLAYLENSETCKRVVRGGSWNTDTSDGPNLLRSSIRWKGKSNGRYHHFGFRVARDLE